MNTSVTLHDKTFVPFLDKFELNEIVGGLARSIDQKYRGKIPLFIVVLNGAFIFAADLVKQVRTDCEISFIRVSSYRGTSSTGEVRELLPLGTDVRNRDIILVEDIVDTGLTMGRMIQRMSDEGASSVSICSLLFKPDAFKEDYEIEFIGKEIEDRFVAGYGLDYDGLGRNLPSIYQLK